MTVLEIRIPLKDNTYFVWEAEKANQKGNQWESAFMKKEVENASAIVSFQPKLAEALILTHRERK